MNAEEMLEFATAYRQLWKEHNLGLFLLTEGVKAADWRAVGAGRRASCRRGIGTPVQRFRPVGSRSASGSASRGERRTSLGTPGRVP